MPVQRGGKSFRSRPESWLVAIFSDKAIAGKTA